ncbi:MAG TPA: hypothetical protein PKV96_03510 [Candidatus Saccharimonas sp.]|jgi:hypothetical protein|nr:hypothetical protein [Candidatus Saccharimonas sp.]
MEIRKPRQNHEYEVPPGTSFHFVYCEHTPEMAPKIAEALENCDVVAVEIVGAAESMVELYSEFLRLASYHPTFEPLMDRVSLINPFFSALCQARPMDHVYPIDARSEQRDVFDVDVTKVLTKGVRICLDTGDYQLLRALLKEEIRYLGGSNQRREQLVVKQLVELARAHPGKRIGVVQGAQHTGTQHEMDRAGIDNTRTMIVSDGLKKSFGIEYPPYDRLIRDVSYGGNLLDDEVELTRAVVVTLEATGYLPSSTDIYGLTSQQLDSRIKDWQMMRQAAMLRSAMLSVGAMYSPPSEKTPADVEKWFPDKKFDDFRRKDATPLYVTSKKNVPVAKLGAYGLNFPATDSPETS